MLYCPFCGEFVAPGERHLCKHDDYFAVEFTQVVVKETGTIVIMAKVEDATPEEITGPVGIFA